MKPDWKDAPEWANWLTMDADGEWWWFELEPILDGAVWMPKPDSRLSPVEFNLYSQAYLEGRP